MKRPLLALSCLALSLLAGCAGTRLSRQPPLDEVLARQATVGPIAFDEGRVLTDNDAAFDAKLQLVEGARQSLDLAYYIFADDHTSSRLAQALIDAAGRGVRVRLLVDYLSAYRHLDRFSWLEQQGRGNLEVRLYNRPSLEIVKDAAFLTLSCADVAAPAGDCAEQKLAAVERHFAPDAPSRRGIADYSFAGSGVFLSGLYGKHPQLMAYAVTRGQAIDTEALAAAAPADANRTEQLKKLGKLYFKARYIGGVDGLAARFQLAFVRLAFGEQVDPVFDAIQSHLPLLRQKNAAAQKDWDYLTEFLHHKFLLADGSRFMLGGRNVEDAYHMHPNRLADKYIFRDTDVGLRLPGNQPALATSFDRLWQLRSMVATLDEVRGHAPNDLLANFDVLQAAQEACNQGKDTACVDRLVEQRFVPLAARLQAAGERHRMQLSRHAAEYRPLVSAPPLTIDATAQIFYLENLPATGRGRSYGVRHGAEAATAKNIHAAWRAALQKVCAAGQPVGREVTFHNAYLFMPANLLQDVAAMLDGRRPCAGVTLSLLTNSLATTDLNIVNLLAVWQFKALADHLRETGPVPTAATWRYIEYQPVANQRLSLHSKVMVFDEDVFIGSANADVRSLMMDTNNGVFIRQAPGFVRSYKQGLQQLLAAPGVTADVTANLGRDAAELRVAMNALIDQLLARYAGPERLSDEQRSDLKLRMQTTTQKVYDLSREIIRGNTKAADEFNALFKAI